MNKLDSKLPLTALMTPCNSSTITRTHRLVIETFAVQFKSSRIN